MSELISMLNEAKVRYLVIGGQAMRLAGMPRFSMDWDFFIPPKDEANLRKLNELFAEDFDFPLLPLGPGGENFIQTYQTHWGVVQFHLTVPGVPRFDEAEARAVIHKTETGIPARCLCGLHLLESKRAAGRPRDEADIEFLSELQRLGKL